VTRAAFALALALVLAGCGGPVVAHESIERLLARRLPGAGRIRCPDVDDVAGRRFECTATGGRYTTIRVQMARNERIRLLGAF
jgi:hypothetical protein